MTEDRLKAVLERCRARLHPDLAPNLVAKVADIQIDHQFADAADRKEPLRDLQQLLDEEMQRLGHGGTSR